MVNTAPGKRTFEYIMWKGENAGNQHFLLLPQCFLSFQENISYSFFFFARLTLSSAVSNLNLNQSDFFSFTKPSSVQYFNETVVKKNSENVTRKRERCQLQAFPPFFSHHVFHEFRHISWFESLNIPTLQMLLTYTSLKFSCSVKLATLQTKTLENTVGKVDSGSNQHLLHFPKCFLKPFESKFIHFFFLFIIGKWLTGLVTSRALLSRDLSDLTQYHTTKFRLVQIQTNCRRHFKVQLKRKISTIHGRKTLWEKEKLLVTRNFFFSHNVFHSYIS